ncbi:MAG: DNA adenine methylase [candidate division WOR-3 bacterium]
MKFIKSVIPYIGGKYYMLKHLLPLLPPHNVYVEVFGGAANLLINKPPSHIEVYNDINSDLVTLWRVVRDKEKLEELKRLLYLTPYSREEFNYLKYQNTETLSDVEKAYRFYYICRCAYNGMAGVSFSGRAFVKNKAVFYFNSIDKLDIIHERFKYVIVENQSFEKLIPQFDDPHTLFYLDPPYIHEKRHSSKYYQYEMKNEQHKQLVSILLNTKGMCILSGYMHEIYQPLLDNNWKKIEINAVAYSKCVPRQEQQMQKRSIILNEVVFLNPQCINALKQSNILSN